MPFVSASKEEDLKIAQRYFFGGFLGLPLLWLLSAIHFWPKAREHKELRPYVYGSVVGAILGIGGFIAWVVYFQLNWRDSEALQSLLMIGGVVPYPW